MLTISQRTQLSITVILVAKIGHARLTTRTGYKCCPDKRQNTKRVTFFPPNTTHIVLNTYIVFNISLSIFNRFLLIFYTSFRVYINVFSHFQSVFVPDPGDEICCSAFYSTTWFIGIIDWAHNRFWNKPRGKLNQILLCIWSHRLQTGGYFVKDPSMFIDGF